MTTRQHAEDFSYKSGLDGLLSKFCCKISKLAKKLLIKLAIDSFIKI